MAKKIIYPAIFAHRGGSANAPENTLAAFREALSQQVDGIELDVHLSADSEVIVIHDSELDRTTDGSGSVYKKELPEIKRLDAGSWFGEEFVGVQVPTLNEVFDLVGDQCLINVELKGPGLIHSKLPAKVAEIVRKFNFEERVIFSSFNPWQLRQIGTLLPKAKLGLLLPPGFAAVLVRALTKPIVTPWGYHPHFKSVNSKFLHLANNEERPVLAWTVNHSEDIDRLCAFKISWNYYGSPS